VVRYSDELTVTTPEGIRFSLPLAGPAVRSLAWFLDAACVTGVTGIVAGILRLTALVSDDFSTALIILAGFVLSVGYSIILEWRWRGQTLGKRLFRIRVTDVEGLRLTFSQVAVRNLLRAVDSLPACYLVGGISVLVTGKLQRLGDLAAGTVVVRVSSVPAPELESLGAEKFNSLRDYPELVARLRREVAAAEAATALRGALRRDELEPEARVAFFAEVAALFREKVAFPPEAVEGMPDERFVRNVLEIVYRVRERKDVRGVT
jgi:uncharacterized RDD family membrane protein YckC